MRIITCIIIAAIAASPLTVRGEILLTNATPTYFQDFNTLAATGTNNLTLPTGWFILESGSAANDRYGTTNGNNHPTSGLAPVNNTYSFGQTGNSDRALGGIRGTSVVPTFGARITNGGEAVINSLSIGYKGEQWRLGTSNRVDRIDFQYSLNATGFGNGDWTDVNVLDFASVLTLGAVTGYNGDSNALMVSGDVSGLSIAPGSSLWIRWVDFDAEGADDGLAVDDFNISATFGASSAPEPTTMGAFAVLGGIAAISARLRRRKEVPMTGEAAAD